MKYRYEDSWGWYSIESQEDGLWLYECSDGLSIWKEIVRAPEGLEIVDEADLLADNGKKAERIIEEGSLVKILPVACEEPVKDTRL